MREEEKEGEDAGGQRGGAREISGNR